MEKSAKAILFWEWCTEGLKDLRFFELIRGPFALSSEMVWRKVIAVHVWMIGVGFIVLFMTPFFIAVHTGDEDADE